ncbi:transcriptional regulator [Natrinema saccharevitans]|uniref:Transcriptional regulator n=1 Tax=Natrinema saccharevitans TaxID=301967 RepID=A0A1S8AWM2_9EURY|nr:helix-turn-helix domain-containing protein [Natrinema saccharevitans]OLZ40956.1 transcriptional regulator [Natrinema saccharevitans]
MSFDDTDEGPVDGDGDEPLEDRDVVEPGTERRSPTVEELDQRLIDLLSWILDTETRAKIYVFLLANQGSTSEEVAKGTGLYPSTVREALAELHEEERVTREKRENEGAGNNPYEYTAIQPSELVGGVVDQVQAELNTIFALDRIVDRETPPDLEAEAEPVTITIDDTAPILESDESDETDTDVIEFEDETDTDTVGTDADGPADGDE